MRRSHLVFLALVGGLALGLPALVGLAAGGGGGEVPRGTILAWVPPEGAEEPPPGWRVCDRATHEQHPWVPDLSGRFLAGADVAFASQGAEGALAAAADVGKVGGSASHGHPRSRTPLEPGTSLRVERGGVGAREAARANHRHGVQIAPESHLPPFYKVVYIIKE